MSNANVEAFEAQLKVSHCFIHLEGGKVEVVSKSSPLIDRLFNRLNCTCAEWPGDAGCVWQGLRNHTRHGGDCAPAEEGAWCVFSVLSCASPLAYLSTFSPISCFWLCLLVSRAQVCAECD